VTGNPGAIEKTDGHSTADRRYGKDAYTSYTYGFVINVFVIKVSFQATSGNQTTSGNDYSKKSMI
jgi:hypothetical protein